MPQPENQLVVFFGMIAMGKSYLASAWASHYGLQYYNSDKVRKELAGLSSVSAQQEELDQGIYSPEFSRRTYDALIEYAAQHFNDDKKACVVLDGSYQSFDERELLRKHFASEIRIVFVHCFCAEKVVRSRLEIRASDPNAVSDGNWKVYLSQKKRFQPVKDFEQVLNLDTDAPVEELMKKVTNWITV